MHPPNVSSGQVPKRARVLDGKAIAAQVRTEVAARVAACTARGVVPGLAVVLIGDDAASQVYVRAKTRACKEVGIATFDHRLPATSTQSEVEALVRALSADPRVHGVLLQLPLPAPLDAAAVLSVLSPDKDVDGLLPQSVGALWSGGRGFVPCTPLGVMRLLREAAINLAGAHAVILGRSQLVGKPMAALLLSQNATVTLCHSRTRDLPALVGQADILVAAIGRAEHVRGHWLRPGATVIDVGINRTPDGRIVGDVAFDEATAVAGIITPVPGGVGPLTIAMLLENTTRAAEQTMPGMP